MKLRFACRILHHVGHIMKAGLDLALVNEEQKIYFSDEKLIQLPKMHGDNNPFMFCPTTVLYSKHRYPNKDNKHARFVEFWDKQRISIAANNSITRRRRFECRAQLAELAPAASAAYGLLLLGGGLFAYSRSGSKGSLYGGLTGGALSAAAYYLMQAQATKPTGDALAFGSAFIFACVFGIRLAATRKVATAGPLLGLSIFALIISFAAYLQDTI